MLYNVGTTTFYHIKDQFSKTINVSISVKCIKHPYKCKVNNIGLQNILPNHCDTVSTYQHMLLQTLSAGQLY